MLLKPAHLDSINLSVESSGGVSWIFLPPDTPGCPGFCGDGGGGLTPPAHLLPLLHSQAGPGRAESEGGGGQVLSGESDGALTRSALGEVTLPGSTVRLLQRPRSQQTSGLLSHHGPRGQPGH